MIPKVIHYCWFGRKPLPELAKKCIASWQKFLPDYEIKEWNEDNFDVNIIPYTAEAYKARKYAFVSDYARFWILYKYGGLYFDTDVEVIRPMDDIIAQGPFMGCENAALGELSPQMLGVNPGLGLGANPGLNLYKDILNYYGKRHYLLSQGIYSNETVVTITTNFLCRKGLNFIKQVQEIEGIWIYPKEYFCPKNYKTGLLTITQKKVSIHHYNASWLPWYVVMEHKICYKLHIPCMDVLNKFFYTKTAWKKVFGKKNC